MFVIGKGQIAALEADAYKRLVADLVTVAETGFPDVADRFGRARIEEVAHLSIERSAGHELTDDRSVAAFLYLMFQHGLDFDRECPWVETTLDLPLAEPARIDRLLDASDDALFTGECLGVPLTGDEDLTTDRRTQP